MVEITVKDFAIKIGCDINRLLNYLNCAGLKHKNADNLLTENDKQILLNYLHFQHGINNIITLTRKINRKIHMENKLIDIQIRKKKTFLKINTEKIERNKNNKQFLQKKDNRNNKKKSLEEDKKKIKKNNNKSNLHTFKIPTKNIIREINIYESNSILYLANKMAIKAAELIKVLFNLGVSVTKNQKIDKDTACLVVEELGHTPKIRNTNEIEKNILKNKSFNEGKKITRIPIITVMGHVDHGKTSLIDCIRKTNLVKKELGGITQHIGVYNVLIDKGKNITIIDTPGHKAFIKMRAIGVKFTDIVILVVSADDGIKPQTIEAIEHAKDEKLPIIVAINKIDKIGIDIERVRNELSKYGLIPEDLGGDTPFLPVSAKTGEGINVLLESVILLSEILELTAVLDSPGNGVIIESRIDIGKGPVAKILVLNGTLNKGDIVLSGLNYGRVRAIIDDLGKTLEKVGPSIPVEIIGLNGIPESGEKINVVSDEKKARDVINIRYIKQKNNKQKNNSLFNQNLFKKREKINTIKIILKVDVQGTLEALRSSINELSNEKIIVKIISASVGNINENDVKLAIPSKAILVGFNVHVSSEARNIIERENISLFYYNIIYKLIDGIKEVINNKLKPKKIEKIIGIAEVRDIFKNNKKKGIIAGCIVREGKILRKNKIRIIRKNLVVYNGNLDSLRRFKEDVNEVSNGMEFGICIRKYNDLKIGDKIEGFDKLNV
ncbi:translation initiation factor IF-2 [Candidatus Portiera aleyrodidarum]|uniref:Translation initiation factor IF-2 n=1 Tax=Candidatus Portiera aleyrodidarum TaxID=91844 RepID=A0A8D9NAP6_9GAMM|nr:translation initiation factor IF-2 [Candidatus Portiera aleyrodidarum]CEI58553.1 Translation initiation factor IF-2 [Candidatus Portiera aleyrodidarum]